METELYSFGLGRELASGHVHKEKKIKKESKQERCLSGSLIR